MVITVTNLQSKLSINSSQIEKRVKKVLKKERKNIAVISVVFVNRYEIRQLNKKFLGKKYFTDVLSFDNSIKLAKKISSWEIVICTDAAIENAKRYKTSVNFELKLYLVHGILHLMGYDDRNEDNRKIMQRKENEILKFLE